MLDWIKKTYNKFNNWCANWMPGFKTKLVAAIGMLGSAAGILQEYVSGLPLDKFMTATQVSMVTAVLFSMAFWFRMLTDRSAD